MSIAVEHRIWIEKNGKPFLGNGRVKLLEAIDTEGSIAKAAASLKMSYKKAWGLVQSMNQQADKCLVEKQTGGKNGGGTRLTSEGRTLISKFKNLEIKSREFLQQELNNCCIE